MTLDEARAQLGVTAGATVDEIRDAFRQRARELHPDLHPSADAADRARLGREFNSAREARDILVRYTSDPLRKPSHPKPQPSYASTPPRQAPTRPPRSGSTAPPPRVTMRFEEFVAWTDAAGFGAGARSGRYVDWARIIVWSTLGLAVAGVVGGAIIYSAVI
ncbi:J domain-containing protein [Microbacterium sp. ASV49]|uniref:DnaJ domain-containing protein n=1 Tax=Microbacterium candidum TaxID=3041922 RepID=A0ABT7MVV9_9MICO|nr:DnaJ domain-containing protein [Microbacterium sp. ASV49]MDL9978593.1 DnaJ domain-containing protein [Microbacterium sp. ASV49]